MIVLSINALFFVVFFIFRVLGWLNQRFVAYTFHTMHSYMYTLKVKKDCATLLTLILYLLVLLVVGIVFLHSCWCSTSVVCGYGIPLSIEPEYSTPRFFLCGYIPLSIAPPFFTFLWYTFCWYGTLCWYSIFMSDFVRIVTLYVIALFRGFSIFVCDGIFRGYSIFIFDDIFRGYSNCVSLFRGYSVFCM